jgi:hypothetical protein
MVAVQSRNYVMGKLHVGCCGKAAATHMKIGLLPLDQTIVQRLRNRLIYRRSMAQNLHQILVAETCNEAGKFLLIKPSHTRMLNIIRIHINKQQQLLTAPLTPTDRSLCCFCLSSGYLRLFAYRFRFFLHIV